MCVVVDMLKIITLTLVPFACRFQVSKYHFYKPNKFGFNNIWRRKEDKDLFIRPQEFVVGYSKAPEQPQSSARPICHSHPMTRTGREPATVRIAA